jgi:salicylate hydroxylase
MYRYGFLDRKGKEIQESREGNDFDSIIRVRVQGFGLGGGTLDWIYKNDIEEVWRAYVAGEQAPKL